MMESGPKRTLGQAAYDTFLGKAIYDVWPDWEGLAPEIAASWEKAAAGVLAEYDASMIACSICRSWHRAHIKE